MEVVAIKTNPQEGLPAGLVFKDVGLQISIFDVGRMQIHPNYITVEAYEQCLYNLYMLHHLLI